MSRPVLLLILTALAVAAQMPARKTQPVSPAKTTASATTVIKKTKAVVTPSTPVVTIHGLCADQGRSQQGSKAGSCATVLTRRDFEAFLKVMSATTTRDIDPTFFRSLAEGYTAVLVSADAGQSAGVDKDPRFQQVMEVTRLRALGDMYQARKIVEARNLPPEDIEAYYKKNIDSYDEMGLDRLVLPKNNLMNLSDKEFQAKAKRVAEELHARAVKGEDFYKLAKEGLEALGSKDPPVIAVAVRKGQLVDDWDKEIFALGPGQVTPILETEGVWTFYKRTSREMLSLDTVKGEIAGKLYHDKIDSLDKSLHDAVRWEYNDDYFGPDPAARVKPEAKPAGGAAVAPGAVVLTIHGLCGRQPSQEKSAAGSCITQVTREQFETLRKITVSSKSNPVPPSLRSVAEGYIDTLIYGEAGEKAGIDSDPRFPEILKLARKRALADMYRLKRDEAAQQISAAAIEAYYKNNIARFEEVTLRHISVPREKPLNSRDSNFDGKAKRLAGELRERAAKGEDMSKLQKEAYEKLGLQNPPEALMQPLRKGALEEKIEQSIFALKPAQVTAVVEIPPAYVVYKLESRRTVPLKEARAEIEQMFFRQNLAKAMAGLYDSARVEYNKDYFPSTGASGVLPASAPAGASAKPVAAR